MTNQSSETSNQEGMSGSLPPEGDSAKTLNIRGYQHLLAGRPEEALSYFQRALALAPGSPVILNNLGNALFNLNHFDEAQDAYKQAIEANPDYINPYRNLALLYQLQSRNNEAISVYRQYLNRVPEDGEALHNMGLLYMAERRMAEASAAFESAAEHLSPNDAESATNLGVGYFYRGDLDRAVELLEHARTLDPSFVPARYHLGLTYLYQGRCQEAIEALEAVIAAEPDHPQATANLGVAYNTAGQPDKAITIFEALIKQQPDNPSIILNMGYAYQDAGFTEKAVECFHQVIATTASSTSYAQKAQQALSKIRDIVT